jgi:hypothetical protein
MMSNQVRQEHNMSSYNNDPAFKRAFVREVRWHKEQDRQIKGSYSEDNTLYFDGRAFAQTFRGCAVGCALHSLEKLGVYAGRKDSHAALAARLGIPVEIVYLEDQIFEGLAREFAMRWPLRFAEAIPVGKNLDLVWPKFALWLLGDPDWGVLRHASEEVRPLVQTVIDLFEAWVQSGAKPPQEKWDAARATARAFMRTPLGATVWAVATVEVVAEHVAGDATWYATWYAARAAAKDVLGAAAWSAAAENWHKHAANKLIHLIKEA